MNETYIKYMLKFKSDLRANEEICFNGFRETYINRVIISAGESQLLEVEKYPTREMTVYFNEMFLTDKDLENIEDFILEFLYKLTLHMESLFPKYREVERFFNGQRVITGNATLSAKVRFYDKIPSDYPLLYEDIKFKENIECYKKCVGLFLL